MDPITTAILAAVSAFATKRAGEALEGAYSVLRSAIRKKFGKESDLFQAVEAVEEDPTNLELRRWLKAEIDAVRAARNTTIKNAAESVLGEVRGMRGGQQIIKVARDGGVFIDGNVYTGNIRVSGGGDFVGGNKYVNEESPAYIPKTPIGWILGVPAAICALAGFVIFFFSFADAFSSSSDSGDEFFSDAGLAFRLIIVGFVVGAIAVGIDKAISSRR